MLYYALCILSVTLQGGIILGWNSISTLFPVASTTDWALSAGCNALSATVSSLTLARGFPSRRGILIGTAMTSVGLALLAVFPDYVLAFKVACALIAAGGPIHHTSVLWDVMRDNEHMGAVVTGIINCGFETSALMFFVVSVLSRTIDLPDVLSAFAILVAFSGGLVYVMHPCSGPSQQTHYEIIATSKWLSGAAFTVWFVLCSQCLQSYIASVDERASDVSSIFDVILALGWVCMPLVSWCMSKLDDTASMCLVLSVMVASLQLAGWPGATLVSLGRYMLYTVLFVAAHRIYGGVVAGNVLAASFTCSAIISFTQSMFHLSYVSDTILAITTPFVVTILPIVINHVAPTFVEV